MKTIKTILLAAIAMMAWSVSAQSLNYTDKFATMATSDPIIRELTNNSAIVCYSTLNSSCTFAKITDGVSTVQELDVDVDSIYDFLITNGNVYFCGMKIQGQSHQAVMGYFPYTSFSSSTTAYYIPLPWLRRLRKLTVANYANNTHVIAIGDENTGDYAIVDAIPQTSSWVVNYSYLDASYGRLEGMTVIDSYVIFTSRVASTGYVWFFNKPTNNGGTLFLQYASYTEIPSNAKSPLLAHHGSGLNNFYVVTVAGGHIKKPPVYVHAYNGTTYQSTTTLNTNANSSILEDIRYDYLDDVVEVLLYNGYMSGSTTTWKGEVYNTYPLSTTSPKTIYGHTLAQKLTSLSPQIFQGFVTCSYDGTYLSMYRYQLTTQVCISRLTKTTTRSIENQNPIQTLYFDKMDITIVPNELSAAYKEESATRPCSF